MFKLFWTHKKFKRSYKSSTIEWKAKKSMWTICNMIWRGGAFEDVQEKNNQGIKDYDNKRCLELFVMSLK